MAYKVLLSYSWENSAERAALAHQLSMIRGVSVLFDKKHVGLGTEVHRELSGLLSKADCIVALLTKPAVASKEVLDELIRAHERGKRIVPIIAEDVRPDSLPWFLREINAIKYSMRDFDSILAAVEATVRDSAMKSVRRNKNRPPTSQGDVTRVSSSVDNSSPTVTTSSTGPTSGTTKRTAPPTRPSQSLAKESSSFFNMRETYQRHSKYAVARFVVENYLLDGDSLLLDAGSSLYPIAEMIAEKACVEPGRTHFTIMTHNYRALQILIGVDAKANLNVVSSGGRYNRDLNAFLGPQTVNAYADYFPRVVILGVSGLRADLGLFCHGHTEELAVKAFIFRKQTRDRIIVADHTKLGHQDGFRFGESNGLCTNVSRCVLVTSSPPADAPMEQVDLFEREIQLLGKYGVDVTVVEDARGG